MAGVEVCGAIGSDVANGRRALVGGRGGEGAEENGGRGGIGEEASSEHDV